MMALLWGCQDPRTTTGRKEDSLGVSSNHVLDTLATASD
jgi:hypothetical protein